MGANWQLIGGGLAILVIAATLYARANGMDVRLSAVEWGQIGMIVASLLLVAGGIVRRDANGQTWRNLLIWGGIFLALFLIVMMVEGRFTQSQEVMT